MLVWFYAYLRNQTLPIQNHNDLVPFANTVLLELLSYVISDAFVQVKKNYLKKFQMGSLNE